MNDYKISIILPIYNLELELVKKCVDSILTQTYTNWECILVDDGSSEEFIHKDYYNSLIKDNHFKYFYKSNEGLAVTRNFGFNKSTGDLVWFVDPDDHILKNEVFNFLVEIFNKYQEIDFINFCFFSDVFRKNKCIKDGVYFNDDNFPIDFNWHTVWRNIYKKQFLIKNHIMHQNKRINFEDVYWDLLVKTNFKQMYYTNKQLYFYNSGRNNSICNKSKNVINNMKIFIDNINETFKYIKDNKMNLERFMYHSLYFYAFVPFLESDFKKSMYAEIKINKIQSIRIKLAILISKNNFLTFLYKMVYIMICYVKKILK